MRLFGILLFTFMASCSDRAQGEEPKRVDEPLENLQKEEIIIAPQPPPTVTILDSDLGPRLPLSAQTRKALAQNKHQNAAVLLQKMDRKDLNDQQNADLDFLLAWTLIHTSSAKKAVSLIPKLKENKTAPIDYLEYILGNLELKSGNHKKAAAHLQGLSTGSVLYTKSMLLAVEALEKTKEPGAKTQAKSILERLSKRPDPATNGAEVLLKMAKMEGLKSAKAYPLLRRIWAHYPKTKESIAGNPHLKAFEKRSVTYKPGLAENSKRIESLMNKGMFKTVISLVEAKSGYAVPPSPESCMIWYAYGRSLYKVNRVTDSINPLKKVGERCRTITPDLSPRSYYIAGKSMERKKGWNEAGRFYQQIPLHFPSHSMADDGYTLAGIAFQESGQSSSALRMWQTQVEKYPAGDMIAEGYWRYAWNTWLKGDTKRAIKIAEDSFKVVPLTGDTVHAMALKYWAARWKTHPSVKFPARLNKDKEVLKQGIKELTELCRNHPSRFYSLLASQRLREISPELLNTFKRPDWNSQLDRWEVSQDFMEWPEIQGALKFAQLGLPRQAVAELRGFKARTPTEKSIFSALIHQYKPQLAHDQLHKYLNKNPPSTYRGNHKKILLQAYPNTYWDLTEKVAKSYNFDPRIFHGLVREESSFNKDIVSWAGARGLSQLMPRTGRAVAKWLKMRISKKQFFNPEINLKIGSKYFAHLIEKFNGNTFLAVGGYNAGGGNINKWLKSKGNLPTDAFVESIPIRETRGYVKRVLGTYQVYRTIRQDGELYPDWTTFNHKAQP